MLHSSTVRSTLAAVTVLAGIGFSSAAQAGTCAISFSVLKGGWVIGASETRFNGRATFVHSPYDVAGVYGAAGAGAAVGLGAQAIVLRNEKGATLQLTGQQVGLQVNADLSGLAISIT